MPKNGPERILDLCIRTGPFGDRLGEKPEGLTLQQFKDAPDGLLFGHAKPQGAAAITTPSGKIELMHSHFINDLPRLEQAINTHDNKALLLVSRRHLGSMNSWMHNIDKLVRGKERCTLQIHPSDAKAANIAAGDHVIVSSVSGQVTAIAELIDDIRQGIVCLPHGWGHQESEHLHIAKQHPGVNINQLSPGSMVDEASGNAVLNGIPVTLKKTA